MGLHELNKEQKLFLKQQYLCSHQEVTSWGNLANADELVSDSQLEEEFGHISFAEEDF